MTESAPSPPPPSKGPLARLWPGGLLGRLAWAFLAPTLIFVTALIALGFLAAREALEAELGARLKDTAAATAATMPGGLVKRFTPEKTRTHANLMDRLSKVTRATGARRAFLARLEGISLVDTAPDAPAPGTPDRDLDQDRYELSLVAQGQTAASVLYEAVDGVRYKRGFAPVYHQEQVVAVVGIEGSAADYAALDALRNYMIAVGVVALLALGLVVTLFSRAVTAPLARLVEASRRIGEGDLSVHVEARGADEIRALAQTMDEMADALQSRRAELQSRRAELQSAVEALQARERELQLMLGGIAHEVRNPLGGMELFCGLLSEDLAEQPEQKEMLDKVIRELGTLKRIVEEFLEFARRVPVDPEPISLGELLFEVQGLLGDLEIEGPLPWAEPDDPRADVEIHADRPRLRRLLINLAGNAAQAGASTFKVQVATEVEPARHVISLADDGPGIQGEVAERLFDAFYTTREKGTGLGLALCRRIAEEHDGALDLANPGEPGACFRLTLPARG